MDMKKWTEKRAERICQFCNKVFCCVKCRDRHTNKEHPDLNINCSLCVSKTLLIRQFKFETLDPEDEKLLCHIIEKHLPLRCQLCRDLFEKLEDFQSIGTCKWKSQRQSLISPTGLQLQKSNQCLLSDIDDSRFITPSEIHRKTSTPMLVGQKTSFEYHTPCVPNFSLKTPKTNSSSITQSDAVSKSTSQLINTGETDFFTAIDIITPVWINKNEQLSRSNSARKLAIMEEQNENINTINTKVAADEDRVSSTVNMDLTCCNVDVILQDSLVADVTREKSCRASDVTKKVRFSDQFNGLEIENLKESYINNVLDGSVEEEFYDAYDVTDVRNTKNTKKIEEENTINIQEDTKSSQEEKKCFLEKQLLENSLANSKIKVILNNTPDTQKEEKILDNTIKIQKENQNPTNEISNGDSSVTDQQSSNRMLMMIVVENNSRMLSTDLMPLIDSSLQKLHEQLVSTSQSQSPPSMTESLGNSKVRRKSILKMEMSISTIDTYLVNKETITTHQEVLSSSPLPVQNCNNSGFLTAIAQAMKHAFRSFSFLSNPRSIGTEVVERREIITKSTTSREMSTDEASTSSISNQTRPGKRNREVSELPTKMDSRTPVAKRHKGWYTMIKGRQPIGRMRESRMPKSPRGVSTETQVFSQGSLTVRDTIIPLPARAHQSSSE